MAYDFVTAAIGSVMRELCGEDWRPLAVHLPRARPRNLQPYRSVFGGPLKFHALQAGLVVDGATLTRRVATADLAARRRLLGRARSELQLEPVVVRDVRRAILLLLERGTCSRSRVAAYLAMHERALGRRLLRAETTFQALLDETRATVAQERLRGTDETVDRIARTVGYRDSTVLGRAFRRWTGMTPRQYRSGHRVPPGERGWGDGARN
jgi:AraC-like DNA-binding protein